jgi:hypothetical protein
MATVRLDRCEARQGNLPPVCIRCGIAASGYRKKWFYYSPWWCCLGIPFGDEVRLSVPFCLLHRNVWRWQQSVLFVTICVLSFVFELVLFGLASQGKYAIPALTILGILLSGPWLVIVAMIGLKYLGIYATEVTPSSVTLTGVAAEFAEAVRVHQQRLTRTLIGVRPPLLSPLEEN